MISTPFVFSFSASTLTASTASVNFMSGPGLLKNDVSGVMYPIIPGIFRAFLSRGLEIKRAFMRVTT